MRVARVALMGLLGAVAVSCSDTPKALTGISSFAVTISKVDGKDPPAIDAPLPANRGDHPEKWDFEIEARGPDGKLFPFNGYVRLSTKPGTVLTVTGDAGVGRNVLIKGGKATGTAEVTAVYGSTRLWVEDIGYTPAPPGKTPACANGKNDDPAEDQLVDFPADPGCAYADDDTEEDGTHAAGVSPPVHYELPKLSDIQGQASTTPYPYESIQVYTDAPQRLIVTRVASDGFYVTDIADEKTGYNHIFAFNFSTPAGMRVCDQVTYLAGTVNEFFGYTELSFPSFKLNYPIAGKDKCEVPEPAEITDMVLNSPIEMEKIESGLVRISGYSMPTKFGPGIVKGAPSADASNCDLNGDGQVDFASETEGGCASVCEADPECSEWTTFSARSEVKVHKGGSLMQVDFSSASNFEPVAHKGLLLDAVTGTLRNFSGGTLNWTVQTRCSDDVACGVAGACVPKALSSQQACVTLRTVDDNDQGTN
jgi:hypothetical protein